MDLRNNEIRNAWSKYDRIVALAGARDIQIVARLSNPPTWSRAAGDALGEKAPPDFLDAYGDYVEAVVSRYRGQHSILSGVERAELLPGVGAAPGQPGAVRGAY